MFYAGHRSNMEDIYAWVSYPFSKEDQVVSHTLEAASDYDPMMSLTLTQILGDDEPFEEDPIKEEEKHHEEFGGVPVGSSPYPYSSSHDDHTKTHEEETADLDSSLEIVSPQPPSFRRSFGSRALGPKTITTSRKSVRIPPH